AFTLGGAGVVGLGIGTAFGLSAISQNSESNDAGCKQNECTTEAAQIRKDAQAAGNVSTVAFIAGGALLAAGVVVYLTAPSSSEKPGAARLVLGPGSVAVRGSFR
ncbi:MAG TPA: hypothetical protein VFZ53_07465, partial [Polyangiaceae bacterium]